MCDRLPVGPRQGRKVFTLQTLPDERDADESLAISWETDKKRTNFNDSLPSNRQVELYLQLEFTQG